MIPRFLNPLTVYFLLVALAAYILPIWVLVTIHVACLITFAVLVARDIRKYGPGQDTWP